MKIRIMKTILWFLTGLGLTVLVMRIIHGPGSVTVLTDLIPWGLWKGGGVVALVAIGGAGFTLAMLVYIFHLERFQPLVRGAVLLALLCYASVGLGLTVDIGIWWRIIFPVFYWQVHSVLFEVAWCIMLYLGVLVFEFSHTILERFGLERLERATGKLTIGFVIAGISLSTLHQSSLGTLFLATPFRLHPLWHTDFLPLFFFITAIAIGCLTISLAAIIVHWFYNAKPPMRAISGLGRLSAWLMSLYLVLRFIEIFAAGESAYLFQASWDTANFWFEVILSAALPAVLLFNRRLRASRSAMFWIALCATVGLALNRVNVAGLATLSLTRSLYIPSWMEWAVTLGILAGAALVYLFFVENFQLFQGISAAGVKEHYEPGHLDHTDWRALFFGHQHFGELRLYSFAFIFAVSLSLGALPDDALYGVSPERTTVFRPRAVAVAAMAGMNPAAPIPGESPAAVIANETAYPGDVQPAREQNPDPGMPGGDSMMMTLAAVQLMIDGNRDGRYVVFDHERHIGRGRDAGDTCTSCHHMSRSFEAASPCYECHSDMYLPASIFDHQFHANKLGGNTGCRECHQDPAQVKHLENTRDCVSCHETMVATRTRIRGSDTRHPLMAPGYMDAMHKLCVPCHEEQAAIPDSMVREDLARCTTCHGPNIQRSETIMAGLRPVRNGAGAMK